MSKMGISAVNSYRGAQLFEAVGLDRELVDVAFTGVTSRIGGVTLDQLEKDQWQVASRARSRRKTLDQGGLLKYVHGGEYHAYNPDVVMSLQEAVVSGDYGDYQRYAKHCNDRPVAALRDLLQLKMMSRPFHWMKSSQLTRYFAASIQPACHWARCRRRLTRRWQWG